MERHLPDDLREGVYDAWARAREDILQEWASATDPANLQPRVPRIFRQMSDHLVRFPPQDMTTEQVDVVLERLEAPWPRRVENAFRPIFTPEDEGRDPHEVSRAAVDKVHELGLTPYRAPEPLQPIDEDQVRLVCWMGAETAK